MRHTTFRVAHPAWLATLILPLFAASCSVESSSEPEATTTAPVVEAEGGSDTVANVQPVADKIVDEHAGHNHDTPQGKETPEPKKQETPPAKDPHAGHDHAKTDAQNAARQQNDPTKKPNQQQGKYGGEVDPDAKISIEYGTESKDFGNVRQGAVLEHTFVLKSEGTKPLKIRQAKPTCGCTVGDVLVENEAGEMVTYNFGDEIAPGRKIEVHGAMDTKNKRNQTQVRINVYSNDPVGLTQLGLSANVEPFLTVNPAFLNFGDVKKGELKEGVIDIRTAQAEAVALHYEDRKIPKPQGLELELIPVNPDAEGKSGHWQLKATLGADAQEDQLGYGITIVSDKEIESKDGAAPEAEPKPGTYSTYFISASINARVLGALSCTPQYLSMGLVRPGQVVSRNVRLVSHEEEFQLTNVSGMVKGVNDEEFKWADSFSTVVRPVEGQNAVDVQLRLDGLPEDANGSFKGTLVVSTGHPEKPTVDVVFSGVCRAGVGNAPVKRPNSSAPVKRP